MNESAPYCEESEAAFLGSLILDPERLDEYSDQISAEDFYDIRHSNTYRVLLDLREANKPIDLVAIHSSIKDADSVGGLAYLANLPNQTPSALNISFYAAQLKRKRLLREFNRVGYSIRNILQSAVDDEQATEDIQKILREALVSGDTSEAGEITAKEAIQNAMAEVEVAFNNDGQCVGIPTGFARLDSRLGGLHNGEMVVLAARPSMGKTSLAMNIGEHAAIEEGIPVGVFSLEMTATSLMKRSMSGRGRVNSIKLRDGNLTQGELKSLTAAASKIARAPIYMLEKTSINTHTFRNWARRLKAVHDVRLIVVDYMQLMSHKADSRVQEITKISNAIKATAKELNIPILCLSQLSRASEQQDRPPRLSDLRESGAIEQDADVVAFLHHPSPGTPVVELLVSKNRNGPVGTIELEFVKEHSRFKTPVYGTEQTHH